MTPISLTQSRSAEHSATEAHTAQPASYEWKAVTLMSLGLGLVGIDRFLIVPLMPVLMRDLKLDYQDLGHITGALRRDREYVFK